MRKVLVWAIIAIVATMGLYSGMTKVFGVSGTDLLILLLVFSVPATLTGSFSAMVFSIVLVFGIAADPYIAKATTVTAVIFAIVLALREVADKRMFVGVLLVYLIEGAGIYNSRALESWWPAISAITVFGCWLLALWMSERKSLRLASV